MGLPRWFYDWARQQRGREHGMGSSGHGLESLWQRPQGKHGEAGQRRRHQLESRLGCAVEAWWRQQLEIDYENFQVCTVGWD